MSLLLVVASLFLLTAVFGVVNDRYRRLKPSIGLMLLAPLMRLVLAGVQAAGIAEELDWVGTVVEKLNVRNVLLNGALCLMLFAGSAGVEFKSLGKDRWTIAALAIGATLLACALTEWLLSLVLGWLGVTLALSYALVVGALISPTDPIAALPSAHDRQAPARAGAEALRAW